MALLSDAASREMSLPADEPFSATRTVLGAKIMSDKPTLQLLGSRVSLDQLVSQLAISTRIESGTRGPGVSPSQFVGPDERVAWSREVSAQWRQLYHCSPFCYGLRFCIAWFRSVYTAGSIMSLSRPRPPYCPPPSEYPRSTVVTLLLINSTLIAVASYGPPGLVDLRLAGSTFTCGSSSSSRTRKRQRKER
jgi:hypothetical protein